MVMHTSVALYAWCLPIIVHQGKQTWTHIINVAINAVTKWCIIKNNNECISEA
jgi:hypothetical protein